MGKLDELRRTASGNVDESMGGGQAGAGGYAPRISLAPRTTPNRLIGITRSANAAEIPVEKIGPDPDQPREEFDEESLLGLANTLKAHGLLQPIAVRWDEEAGLYRIIAGERRWRAAGLAGLKSLACNIWDRQLTKGELLAIQMIENCTRDDLKPMEQAKGFRSLMDLNGWSGNQLAKALGIGQPNVVRALALLELPAVVQEQVEHGAISPATAYEVSKVEDPSDQAELAARVVEEGLTRSQTVEAVRKTSGTAKSKARAGGSKKAPRKVTERIIRTSSGSRVTVENRKGLDAQSLAQALAEALATVQAELGTEERDAA